MLDTERAFIFTSHPKMILVWEWQSWLCQPYYFFRSFSNIFTIIPFYVTLFVCAYLKHSHQPDGHPLYERPLGANKSIRQEAVQRIVNSVIILSPITRAAFSTPHAPYTDITYLNCTSRCPRKPSVLHISLSLGFKLWYCWGFHYP